MECGKRSEEQPPLCYDPKQSLPSANVYLPEIMLLEGENNERHCAL